MRTRALIAAKMSLFFFSGPDGGVTDIHDDGIWH
jgi:hypothetical protein